MLPALLFKTPVYLTLVTIECRNFFRSASDSQGASVAAAECSHTVSMAKHVLSVWQTCPNPHRTGNSAQDPQFRRSAGLRF